MPPEARLTGPAPDLRASAATAGPDAFMSYAREDVAVADALEALLAAHGKRLWLDRKDIPYSAPWRERARAGIDASKAVVFVLSPSWVASDACRFELEHAQETGKRLIPVATSPQMHADTLPRALADLAWIVIVDGQLDAAVDALVTTLETDLAWRDAHTRLLVRATEWAQAGRHATGVLRGNDLRAAEEWLSRQGGHRERATPLHSEFIVASRRAATRRLRTTLTLSGVALAVSLSLAAGFYWQRGVAVENQRIAEDNARLARSRQLAATARTVRRQDVSRALLLALEGYRTARTAEARSALVESLQTSPRLVATLPAGRPAVAALCYSHDGTLVAAAGGGGPVTLWDAKRWTRLAVLGVGLRATSRRGAKVQAMTFVGRRLVTAADDGTLAVWDVRRRVRIAVRRARTGLLELARSPDGRLVAGAAADGTVRLWTADRELRSVGRVRRGHSHGPTASVAFSPDGATLASAGFEDGRVVLWPVRRGSLGPPIRAGLPGRHVAFAADSDTLVAIDLRDALRRWRRRADGWHGERIARGVAAMAVDRRGHLRASGAADGSIRLRDPRTLRAVGPPLLGHVGAVRAMAVSPDGSSLVSAGVDETLRVWDAGSDPPLADVITARHGPIRRVALDDTASLLTVVRRSGGIDLTRVGSTRPRATLALTSGGSAASPPEVAFSANGRRLALAGADGWLRVWSVVGGRALVARRRHGVPVTSVALAPDGRVAASSDFEGSVRLWALARSQSAPVALFTTRTPATALRFTPDGQRLLVGQFDGAIATWDVERRRAVKRPLRVADNEVLAMAIDDAHERVAAAIADGRVALLDLAPSPRVAALLDAHSSRATNVAFSRDGRTLASGGADGRIVLWDVAGRRRVGEPLIAHLAGIAAVRFDAWGRVVSADTTGRVLRWDPLVVATGYAAWRRRICRMAGRSLTYSEWTSDAAGWPFHRACPT